MPVGSGDMPAGGTASQPTALLTIIGAACTSETFRTILFHDTKRISELYPDLKLDKDEQKALEMLVEKRPAPNPVELALANVHATFKLIQICVWPSCRWKMDPSPEKVKKG